MFYDEDLHTHAKKDCSSFLIQLLLYLTANTRDQRRQEEKKKEQNEWEISIRIRKYNKNTHQKKRHPLLRLNTMRMNSYTRAQKLHCASISIRSCRTWCGVWSQEAFGTVRCCAQRGKLRALISLWRSKECAWFSENVCAWTVGNIKL